MSRFYITTQHIKKLRNTRVGAAEQDAVIAEISEGLQKDIDEKHYEKQINFLINELTGSAVLDNTYVARILIVADIYAQASPALPGMPLSLLNIVILKCLQPLLTAENLKKRLNTWIEFLKFNSLFQLMTDTFKSNLNEHSCLMTQLVEAVRCSRSATCREKLWEYSWRQFDKLFLQQMRYSQSFADCVLTQWFLLQEQPLIYPRDHYKYHDHNEFLSQFNVKEKLLSLFAMDNTQDQKVDETTGTPRDQLIVTVLTFMDRLVFCDGLRSTYITVDDIYTRTSFSTTTRALNIVVTISRDLFLSNQSYEVYLQNAKDQKYEGMSDELMMYLARRNVSILGALLTLPNCSAVLAKPNFCEDVVAYYFQGSRGRNSTQGKTLKLLEPEQKIKLLNVIFSDSGFQNFSLKINSIHFSTFVCNVIQQPDLSQLSNETLIYLWKISIKIPEVNKRFEDDAALKARALAAIGVVVSQELVDQHAQMQQALVAARADAKAAHEELAKLRVALAALKAEKDDLMQRPRRSSSPIHFFSATHITPRNVPGARVVDSANTSPRAVCDEKSDSEDDDQELHPLSQQEVLALPVLLDEPVGSVNGTQFGTS